MQTASFLKDLFDLSGKTAVVIGGTGELCGAMAGASPVPGPKSCSAAATRTRPHPA